MRGCKFVGWLPEPGRQAGAQESIREPAASRTEIMILSGPASQITNSAHSRRASSTGLILACREQDTKVSAMVPGGQSTYPAPDVELHELHAATDVAPTADENVPVGQAEPFNESTFKAARHTLPRRT